MFANKGISGTSSAIFSACAEQIVPADADLVVLEFSVNDPDDAEFVDPSRKAYEQLLRKVLKRPGAPAVVQLHHYAWWFAHGDGVQFGRFYRPGEGQLGFFANYYDLPAVSVRNALHPLMEAGVEGFKVGGLAALLLCAAQCGAVPGSRGCIPSPRFPPPHPLPAAAAGQGAVVPVL